MLFRSNLANTLALWREADAQGNSLVVFPELNISGYTVRDLFHDHHLLERCEQVLLDLARALGATIAMALVIYLALSFLPPTPLIQLIIAGGLGAVTYVLTAYLLGIKEIVSLPRSLLRGIARPRTLEA